MLTIDNAALHADVAELLGRLKVDQVAPLLAGASGERALVRAIDQYRDGAIPFALDEQNRVTLWQWSDTTHDLSSTSYPVEAARTLWMARLATALAELQPENRIYQRQALLLNLEAAGILREAHPKAPGSPADNVLLQASDMAMLSDVLSVALTQRYSRAAEQVVEAIGARKVASVLYTRDGQPAPLVDALDYPDRRVRFAALAAVMQIAPSSPFPGSSRVPETLGYFARGTGERRAVVAMPTIERAANVAGRLHAAGIDAAPANRGAEAVKLAEQSPDVEFALVDMDIQAPGVRDVIYALRIDPATGHMPIGLLAGEGRLEAAQALAAEHQRVLAFSRPHSDERTAAMADQLMALAGHNDVSPDERAAQSRQAIAWLAELLEKGPTFYNLRRQSNVIQAAALRPEAPSDSLAALAALGTPAGQRALVDLASLQTIPIARRREAAQAFDQSIQEFGLLLTSDEIVRQYDRYNASATADADTQQVLGAVLDTIESQRTPLQTRSPAP
jgi:CheY-like chemotaxis protein